MTQFFVLRQSTSRTLPIGPFIDLTAGTPETALGIAVAEILLSKNGGAFAAKNETTDASHMSNGWYSVLLNASDTDTVGSLEGNIYDSAAQPLGFSAVVLEQDIYDSLYANGASAFNSSGQVALLTATQTSIDAIETDTGTTLDGKINTIDSLVDGIVAQVDTARTEPALGNIDHTDKLAEKVDLIYKLLFNKKDQTSVLFRLYNSDESTVDHKAVVDGSVSGTLTYGELKTP